MGKKGSWFVAVKRAFSHDSNDKKEKKEQRKSKSKKKWGFSKHKQQNPYSLPVELTQESLPPPPLPPPPPSQEVRSTELENEQNKHAYNVALASAAAAEAAVAAAQAAAEVVRLTTVSPYSGKSKEEVAAIRIQTAFRGYLARRALRALRGLVRLKTLIEGQSVKRQVTTTLRCMQTLARVQSQIRARRIRMSEENQALQRQLQQKHEKELETLRASMGDDWDTSLQSKEQIEAKLLSKHEAAMRRERALAYAFSHQQTLKSSSRSGNPTFMDPNNPHWGWSWLERWMAARPWESSRSMADKDLNNDQSSVKSAARSSGGGEISKAYARRDLHLAKASHSPRKHNQSTSCNSPSTPPLKAATSASSVTGKARPAISHGSAWAQEDDTRSTFSMQSERNRRHSITGSSIRDDESTAGSPTFPSYMAPTQSAKAKTRLQSPLGLEKQDTPPEKVSAGSAKKRLSFTASSPAASSAPRRHSGPPKVESVPFKDIAMHSEQNAVSNGGSR